jgi:hypothetical protein
MADLARLPLAHGAAAGADQAQEEVAPVDALVTIPANHFLMQDLRGIDSPVVLLPSAPQAQTGSGRQTASDK